MIPSGDDGDVAPFLTGLLVAGNDRLPTPRLVPCSINSMRASARASSLTTSQVLSLLPSSTTKMRST